MATEITMPKLSDTMEEGTLIAWRKSVGEKVERGDIIAEVETDKANMELESFVSGILLETRFKSGDVVPVGMVIAIVGEAGEITEAERPRSEAEEEVKAAELATAEEEKAVPPEVVKAAEKTEPVPHAAAGEDKASPLVRRMAREKGVDLAMVEGTGPDGRILREDLEKYLEKREITVREEKVEAVEEKAGAPVPEGKPLPFSRIRAAIARNVTLSWRTIPHFSVTVSIDMGEAETLQRSFRDAGVPLSINDIIVKAAAMALKKFPRMNSSFSEEGMTLNPEINIGVVVSVEEGLLVPVLKGCDSLSLKDISARGRDLVDRARQGKISQKEMSGGTFTVSNLGMFGVEEFTAVIYPTQAAILAVGAIRDTAVVRKGTTVGARMMRVTLSGDHRIVDGAEVARFLSELRKILENPCIMLV